VEIFYSGALDLATVENTGHYLVTQKISKKKTKLVAVLGAVYKPNNNSVTLLLGSSTKGKAMQLVASGLRGSSGQLVSTLDTDL
jgi:hypothetical protein